MPPPRTAFNRSPLIRTLASLDRHPGADVAAASQTLAERLGQWLHWPDAISLYGVLDGEPAAHQPGDAPARAPVAASVLAAELRHLRQQLALSIADDAALAAELAEQAEQAEQTERSGNAAQTDWAPCRRRHLALQQAMGARTAPLRASLRAILQARSPALARLAALDAVLEAALAERERHLLAKVPRLLEQHFTRLSQAQARAQTQTAQAAAPAAPRLQPDTLRQTLQRLLLDELDLRLQPLEGLLLALQQDKPATT